MSVGDVLTLADLEAHDPQAPGRGKCERRFCCPLPACAGKRRDAAHRSLSCNTRTGEWHCHRCGAGGKLREFWDDRPAVSRRERARQAFRRFWGLTSEKQAHTCHGDAHEGLEASPDTAAGAENGPQKAAAAEERKADPADAELATTSDTEPPREHPEGWHPEYGNDLVGLAAPKPEPWQAAVAIPRGIGGTPGATYLEARGIPLELAELANLKYDRRFYGRPAVVFALRDATAALVAAHGRHTDGRDDPKSHTGGSLKAGVYWAPGAAMAAPVAIAEAPIDALSLAAAGLPAVALCGLALREWAPRYFAWRHVLLAFDADAKGDEAAEEWAAALRFGTRTERLRPVGAKDWNELLVRDGPDALRAFLAPYLRTPAAIAAEESPRIVSDEREASMACLETAAGTGKGPQGVPLLSHSCPICGTPSAETGPESHQDAQRSAEAFGGTEVPAKSPASATGRPGGEFAPSGLKAAHGQSTCDPRAEATEMLAPFAALLAAAHRGELPPGPVQIRSGDVANDPSRAVLAAERFVISYAASASPTMRGAVAARLETLAALAELLADA